MVMFVLLEDIQTMRDVWKCASVDTGDTSVIMGGVPQGLWLCANSCLETISVRRSTVVLCSIVCTYILVVVVVMCLVCFSVAAPFSYGVFGHATWRIMLYGIICTGSPSRLVDCSYSLVQGYYSGGCYLYEDAGIRCYGKLHLSL